MVMQDWLSRCGPNQLIQNYKHETIKILNPIGQMVIKIESGSIYFICLFWHLQRLRIRKPGVLFCFDLCHLWCAAVYRRFFVEIFTNCIISIHPFSAFSVSVDQVIFGWYWWTMAGISFTGIHCFLLFIHGKWQLIKKAVCFLLFSKH